MHLLVKSVFSLGLWLTICLVANGEKIALVAGNGAKGDGSPADKAQLVEPFGVAFDKTGNLYIIEHSGHRLRKVDAKGMLTTVAGTGERGFSGDGGSARSAQFDHPHGLAIARNGDIYVADTRNNRIRKIDAETGIITTVAGTGNKGFSGDGGPAIRADFGAIYSVDFDFQGENLYLADLDNRRIRVVHLKTGIVDTVAGNGQRGVPKDGANARSSPLIDPRAAAVDRHGNVYILERGGHALRVVNPQGEIRTVVGTGKAGLAPENAEAKKAAVNAPKHLCIDREDNIVIADTNNHIICKYLPREEKVLRIAGTGQKGAAGIGGPPHEVQLDYPHGVFVHPSGSLYIADSSNHRVLKIDH